MSLTRREHLKLHPIALTRFGSRLFELTLGPGRNPPKLQLRRSTTVDPGGGLQIPILAFVIFAALASSGTMIVHLAEGYTRAVQGLAVAGYLFVILISGILSLFVNHRLREANKLMWAARALEEEMAEKAVVDEVSRIVTSTLDIHDVYQQFGGALSKLVDCDRIAIYVVDRESETMEFKHVFGVRFAGHTEGAVVPMGGTHTQIAIETGKTHVWEDSGGLQQYRFDQDLFRIGLRAGITTPLVSKGNVFGALNLRSKRSSPYGPRERAIGERLAAQIAPAVANAELFEKARMAEEEIRRLTEEKAVVDEVAKIITSTLDIQNVYEEFAQRLRQLVDLDTVIITVMDREAGTLEYKYTYGEPQSRYEIGTIVPLKGTRTEIMLKTGKTLVLDDLPEGIRFLKEAEDLNSGLRASINTPLVDRGRIFGSLYLRSKKRGAFGLREQAIIERLANQIAPAVRNAQLYAEKTAAEEVQKRWAEDSTTMAEIGRIISSSLDINQVYEHLGHEIRKLLPYDRMLLSMFDQEAETASRTWTLGTDIPSRQTGGRFELAGTFVKEVIRTRSPIMLEIDTELESLSRFPGLLPSYRAGLKSFLVALLIYRDEVIGALQLRSQERGVYLKRQLDLAERVASQIAGAIANARLYAEREEAEKALRDSEELFRQMAENTREVFFLLDYQSQSLLYVNRAFEDVWGRSRESWYEDPSVWLDAIHPEDIEQVKEALESQRFTGEYDSEYRILRPDGSVRWIHDTVVPIRDQEGQISRLVGIAEDVTERRQAEDKIKASLQEKDVLLKEINHRVKNNLQIVSSLLNLQSRGIEDEHLLRSFQAGQDRIGAMAMVHEKLYQSDDLARIDFGEYIRSLAIGLGNTYGLESRGVGLKIDVENVLLGVDIAIPCGVIVNELVSNSLKHAFPGDRRGEIHVSFRQVDGLYTMTFKDDGVGLPENQDATCPSSLGLNIVNALTGQLRGTINFCSDAGCEISITFPVD